MLPVLFCGSLHAQRRQNVYYFKNNGSTVESRDSADFIRVIQEPDSGETVFAFQENYKNGKRKRIGKLSEFNPIVFEGLVVSYSPEGKKTEAINYEQGKKIGMAYSFFSNGRVKKQVEYLPVILSNTKGFIALGWIEHLTQQNSKLIFAADSAGIVQVKDGNGHYQQTAVIDGDEVSEEGAYKDGFKDGIWRGTSLSGKSSYEETYQEREFVSGVSMANGQAYPYKVIMKTPSFKGGEQGFYEFIGNFIRYPTDAMSLNVVGKVTLSFSVDVNGKTSDIQVIEPLFKSMDNEAKRAIKSSPTWQPGLHRGLPIKFNYVIPIIFSFGR